MENAIDALKMVFAMMVFIMAFTIAMLTFSQAKSTSEIVLFRNDETNYYEYTKATGQEFESRTVGLETIIPTLYKYYKENYTVVFREANGSPLVLYETKSNPDLWSYVNEDGEIDQNFYKEKYDTSNIKDICSFDMEEETMRHEAWTASVADIKRNLDTFLMGGTYTYPSNNGEIVYKGFMKEYANVLFVETLGEYSYNTNRNDEDYNDLNTSDALKQKKKRVITYTKIQ